MSGLRGKENMMIQLRLTTTPGLEDGVEQEIKKCAVGWGYPIRKIQQRPFGLQGQVLVLLVGKGHGAFKKMISQQTTLILQEERLVKTGGLYPHLLICDRV